MSAVERPVVVVTGAAGGIGAAVVERLRRERTRVVALDASIGPEARQTDGIRVLDVTDRAQWQALAAELAEPGVAGLVNCAGITRRARLLDVDHDDMAAAYEVNVLGPLLAIQSLRPVFGNPASVVNVGSMAALTGHYPVAYTCSKWALRGLTHTAAMELGPHGVRVNIVHPGFIDTPMTASAAPEFRDASIAGTSVGRAGTPDEVAAAITFLLGESSTYLNGSEITVDGGATSHGGVKPISDALATTTTDDAARLGG